MGSRPRALPLYVLNASEWRICLNAAQTCKHAISIVIVCVIVDTERRAANPCYNPVLTIYIIVVVVVVVVEVEGGLALLWYNNTGL